MVIGSGTVHTGGPLHPHVILRILKPLKWEVECKGAYGLPREVTAARVDADDLGSYALLAVILMKLVRWIHRPCLSSPSSDPGTLSCSGCCLSRRGGLHTSNNVGDHIPFFDEEVDLLRPPFIGVAEDFDDATEAAETMDSYHHPPPHCDLIVIVRSRSFLLGLKRLKLPPPSPHIPIVTVRFLNPVYIPPDTIVGQAACRRHSVGAHHDQ